MRGTPKSPRERNARLAKRCQELPGPGATPREGEPFGRGEFVDLLGEVHGLVAASSGEQEPRFSASLVRGGDDLSFDSWPEFDQFIRRGGPDLRIAVTVGRLSGLRASVEFERTRWPGIPAHT
jgi:hypothetical protein